MKERSKDLLFPGGRAGFDSHGYVMLTKHIAVTFALCGLIDVGFGRFAQPGLARGLVIEATDSGITLHFDAVQGAHVWIKAKRIDVSFAPKKEQDLFA